MGPGINPPCTRHAAYLASLPRKRMGAGALFFDPAGRVLIVKPVYAPHWEIPGGVVEADESPRAAAAREVAEELGLRVEPESLRLLAVDYLHPIPGRTEALMFVFHGGAWPGDVTPSPRPGEIAEARFVPVDEAKVWLGDILGPRLGRCLDALAEGRAAYHEHGAPPGAAG